MAANRILRDWTDSFIIDQLDVNAERFFVRLIMKVDDYGRFSADERLLKSNLFPLKTNIRETDISRWITECETTGLITVYTVASKKYLEIQNFNQRLRIKSTKYPSAVKCKQDVDTMSASGQHDVSGNNKNKVSSKKPMTIGSNENVSSMSADGQQVVSDMPPEVEVEVEVEVELPPNPQGGIVNDKIDFKKLIGYINKKTGRDFKIVNDAVKRKFAARLKEGYTKDDILSAIKNSVKDQFHRDNNFKFLTPEYFSRSATIDKHRSTIDPKAKPWAKNNNGDYIPGPFN